MSINGFGLPSYGYLGQPRVGVRKPPLNEQKPPRNDGQSIKHDPQYDKPQDQKKIENGS